MRHILVLVVFIVRLVFLALCVGYLINIDVFLGFQGV